MARKLLLLLTLVLTPLVLTACGSGGDTDSTTPTPAEEAAVTYETRTGVIQPLGASIYQQGTHRLLVDGRLSALLESGSETLNLDDYIGQKVELQGIVRPTAAGGLEIFQVILVTPLTVETDVLTYTEYLDTEFGFSVEYPSVFTARQGRAGVAFFDGADAKIIEIKVLTNPLGSELSQYLIDNYGYTVDQLNAVSVAGIAGYQFQNTTGAVIYLSAGQQIYALAWLDTDAANRVAYRQHYLTLVQSFQLLDQAALAPPGAALGEFCGGIGAIQCVTGLKCESVADYPDAGGSCVVDEQATSSTAEGTVLGTAAGTPANETYQAITDAELARGWYYGALDTKKPGTPESWILVSTGTRLDMWRRVEDTPEPVATLPVVTAEVTALTADQQAVWTTLKEQISTYVPEAPRTGTWSVVQLAFADPNYVYAVYTAGEQTRRLLFTYTVSGTDVTLETLSYMRPGETKDWVITEGVDSAFGQALTVVDAEGSVTAEILAGYRGYTNKHYDYTLQYPKDWYWQNATTDRAEFASRPFPAALARITVEVVAGTDYVFDELAAAGDDRVIYTRLSSTQSLRISGTARDAEILQTVAQTVKIN